MSEVAIYQQPAAEVAIRPLDDWIAVVGQVAELAGQIYNTPFVPDGLRGSAPAVAAAILAGREMGLQPMTALQNIHVIKGKPTQSALLMRALIVAQGHEWQDVEVTDTRVIVRGRRKGEAEWAEASFTADQAKRAGIQLGGYPQDKLYARATSRLARRKFADVIMGMPYSAEELEDGVVDDDAPVGEAAAAAPAADAPKARTAQRKRQQPKPHLDQGEQGINLPPAPQAAAEPPLPPLPGEDEPRPTPGPATASAPSSPADGERDYDSPGTVTTPQLTGIWTNLRSNFSFTAEEKEQARTVCGQILGRPLASTKDMSHREARTVLDTLASWREVAERNDEAPRDVMLAALAAMGGGDE